MVVPWGIEAVEGFAERWTMTKITRSVARSNMSCRRVVTVAIFAVFAGHIAKIAHVATGQVDAIEGLLGRMDRGQAVLVRLLLATLRVL